VRTRELTSEFDFALVLALRAVAGLALIPQHSRREYFALPDHRS
jgi:hypothetical protein